MKKLRICSTNNLHSCSKDDVSEYIRQGLSFQKIMGFDAADFNMRLIETLGACWKPCIEQAIADSQEIGLRFEVCHLPYGVKVGGTSEEVATFDAKMHYAIDAAACLGVDYAVVHPNTITVPLENFERRAQYDSVMTHLAPYVEHASKVGVNIVVENMRMVPKSFPVHRYCQEPEELCEIADALGVGVCWDFGHAHINRQKQSEALAYIGSRLKVLHVNDNTAYGDDHLPPFCGTIDWKDVMKGLKNIGFHGLFNYEIRTHNMPASIRESFAKYLVSSAQEMFSYFI